MCPCSRLYDWLVLQPFPHPEQTHTHTHTTHCIPILVLDLSKFFCVLFPSFSLKCSRSSSSFSPLTNSNHHTLHHPNPQVWKLGVERVKGDLRQSFAWEKLAMVWSTDLTYSPVQKSEVGAVTHLLGTVWGAYLKKQLLFYFFDWNLCHNLCSLVAINQIWTQTQAELQSGIIHAPSQTSIHELLTTILFQPIALTLPL